MSSKDALDIDHSVLLSDATLSALQIDQQPFGPLEADSVLYLDETTSEQLADVKQALITGDDLLLILGASGAGKTVLLKQLGENSGLRIQCFAVKGSARFSTLNLFAGMLEAFKRPPPEKLKDILDELIPCLQTMVTRNTLSAIVLDDAHRVTETELTQLLSGMLYLNSQDETLLRVALAAPAEFEDHIPDLLPEGADLPYSSLTIDGMNPSRAADYLSYRLAQAGFEGEWPFSDRDVDNLVAQSGGLPGTLHAITATSLNQRYGPTDDLLTEDLITEPSGSLMDSRIGKLALGVLAAILIVGGLSMFIPERSGDNADRYSSEEAKPLGGEELSQTLKLVEETPVVEPKPFVVAEAQPVDEPQASEGSDPDGTADDTESSISTLADESPDALPAPADTITPSGSAASATASSPDAPVNEDPDVQSPADSIVIVADENPPEPAESDTASAGESEQNSLSPSESAATVPTDTDTPTQCGYRPDRHRHSNADCSSSRRSCFRTGRRSCGRSCCGCGPGPRGCSGVTHVDTGSGSGFIHRPDERFARSRVCREFPQTQRLCSAHPQFHLYVHQRRRHLVCVAQRFVPEYRRRQIGSRRHAFFSADQSAVDSLGWSCSGRSESPVTRLFVLQKSNILLSCNP